MLGVEVDSMQQHAKNNKLNLIIYKNKTTVGAQLDSILVYIY